MAALFRRLSKSTVGTIVTVLFLLAILAGFALQDISSSGAGSLGFGQGGLVKVGDTSVNDRDLSAAMQRRLTELRQQNPQADYSSMAGEFGQILEELVQSRAIQAFARDNDLHLSKRMVDAEIAAIPATRGLNGQFSQEAYNAFLQQQRLTDGELREILGSALASRLLLAPAAANARVPVGVATPYASMLLEAREADVAIIPAELFAAGIPEPGDGDLQAFYKQNSARYMVPEQRVLSIARIGAEQVGKITASDQEVEAFYKANQKLFGGAESRDFTQVVVQGEAPARAVAQRARGGAGLGSGQTSLKAVTRERLAEIAGDQVAAAAFGASQGAIVGPVRSDLGWHVMKLDAITPASGKSLSAVRGDIATKLTADKRKAAIEEIVDKVQTAIDDGASLAEAARAAGLSVTRTPAITAGGMARGQPDFRLPAELTEVARAGFDLAEGDEPVIETLPGDAGYAVVGVEDIITAAPAPLSAIRDQVAADWKAKQALDKARAVANAVNAKVSSGGNLRSAVASAAVRLPPPAKVAKRRLELSAGGGNVPPALGMMFSLAQGRSRMISDPGGRGFIIVHVTKITPGNATLQPNLISRTQTEFQQMAANEYAEQMANAIKADVGVERNESAITAAKQRITGGGS